VNEYALLAASALVSALVNLAGATRSAARRAPRRILVVKLDHLGDVVTATPALRALRDAHATARIDLLLSPATASLFHESPLADRVFAYDSQRYRRGPARPEASLRGLDGERYDVIVELRGDWRTLLLPLRTRAARRLDRGTVRLRDWIRRRLAWARGSGGGSRAGARPPLHEAETNYAVVRPLLPGGAPAAPPKAEVRVPPPAHESLEWRLAEADVDASRPLVAIHPGASWRPRAWLPERFAAIADWVAEHYDAQVVLIGSADERDVEAAVRGRAGKARAISMFGTLTLPELAALLERSRLLVGNDSGIAHLAAACGTPTVALFGPQDPRRFRPWSERSIVLHHPVPCFPCAQVRCVHQELPCVNLIEISEVQAAVRALLGAPNAVLGAAPKAAPTAPRA
jgi:ADP-heptose:LPS heptosyltransferase